MKLGKKQQEWVNQLKKYPERQYSSKLGHKDANDKIRACCLGQALICMKGRWAFDEDGEIYDGSSDYPKNSFEDIGLITYTGEFKDGKYHQIGDCYQKSLADANDDGATWLEIAEFIENNPEVVFNKSV